MANCVLKGILRHFQGVVEFYPYLGKSVALRHVIRERRHIEVIRLLIVDYPYLGVLAKLIENGSILLKEYSTKVDAKGKLLVVVFLEVLDNLSFKFLFRVYDVRFGKVDAQDYEGISVVSASCRFRTM